MRTTIHKKYNSVFKRYGVDNHLRLAHFLGQCWQESKLQPIQEDLRYSASTMLKMFPNRVTPLFANEFAYKAELIANKVYGGRMGNTEYGDGYKYRGRGIIQLTGKDNYRLFENHSGINVVGNPDLLLVEANAVIAALWYWKSNNLNRFADKDDYEGLTRAINGGKNHLKERILYTNQFKEMLKNEN